MTAFCRHRCELSRSVAIGTIAQLALIQSLGVGISFLKAQKNVTQISASQFAIGFPFDASSTMVANEVVHGPFRLNAVSVTTSTSECPLAKPLKDVKW